jgi:hypothetical protein
MININTKISQHQESLDLEDPFVTDPNIDKSPYSEDYSTKKIEHIYNIDKAVLPTSFESGFEPLPNSVEFKRIVSNIMNALKMKKTEVEDEKQG